MQLKNDAFGRNQLKEIISNYYQNNGHREVLFFLDEANETACKINFLLQKRRVIRYVIGLDRGLPLGVIELSIGPYFFSPSDFWSYENSQRFSLELNSNAITGNLFLLDEFFQSEKQTSMENDFKAALDAGKKC